MPDQIQRTMSMSVCEPDHPPRSEWPTQNLVRGMCPVCGSYEGAHNPASARVLRGRRLIEQLDRGDESAFEALADEAEEGWTEPTDAQRAEGLRRALAVMTGRVERLALCAAAALERADVGDAEESAAILRQVVTLDGRYVDAPKP